MMKKLLVLIIVALFSTIGFVTADIVLAEGRLPDVTVAVFNFGFNPDPVTIQVGDTVTWNNTQGFHNVSSTSGPEAFRNGDPAGAGWTYSKTFTQAGTYTYVCEVHSSMQGTIIVEGEPTTVEVSAVSAETPPALSTTLASTLLFPLMIGFTFIAIRLSRKNRFSQAE